MQLSGMQAGLKNTSEDQRCNLIGKIPDFEK